MNKELLNRLSKITDEERSILNGGALDMSVYSDNMYVFRFAAPYNKRFG